MHSVFRTSPVYSIRFTGNSIFHLKSNQIGQQKGRGFNILCVYVSYSNYQLASSPSSQINANKGSCNEARILELQRRRIEEAYVAKGSTKISYAEEEDSDQQIATASDPTQLVCKNRNYILCMVG